MYQFYANNNVFADSIAMYMRSNKLIATKIEFEQLEPGVVREPFMHLQPEEAQELMDQLYSCGIRPSKERGSAGQLDAVKYHLEDMRKLVFKNG